MYRVSVSFLERRIQNFQRERITYGHTLAFGQLHEDFKDGGALGESQHIAQDWVILRPGGYREVCLLHFLATKKTRTQIGSVWSTELPIMAIREE